MSTITMVSARSRVVPTLRRCARVMSTITMMSTRSRVVPTLRRCARVMSTKTMMSTRPRVVPTLRRGARVMPYQSLRGTVTDPSRRSASLHLGFGFVSRRFVSPLSAAAAVHGMHWNVMQSTATEYNVAASSPPACVYPQCNAMCNTVAQWSGTPRSHLPRIRGDGVQCNVQCTVMYCGGLKWNAAGFSSSPARV